MKLPSTLLFLPAILATLAFDAAAADKTRLDDATRKQVLSELGARISEVYVFPDKAKLVVDRLQEQEQRGAYRAARNLDQFASMLTKDLRHPTRDKHLGVWYSAQPVPDLANGPAQTPDMDRKLADYLKARNYGIRKVETLPGNIGYIDLRSFPSARFAKPALGAAMTLVADTDALIVDLRHNGGGDPHAVAYMSSYLFDRRTHLNDMHWREGARTESFWTEEDVPGKKFGGAKKVYVLTSKDTFSGAEEFSYNLQQLRRGVIVGETTGGGAHPGRTHRIHPHMQVFIPGGQAINPVSKTNWEGTGVVPDVRVKAADALKTAERLALTELLKSPNDDEHAASLRKRLDALK
ncbi:S41 family peptidase [Massilia consociata]|uniref:S41 family peptidase n=1 Tax=Massilia consociata TaxID=760117 RepID=A0ABV6FAK4_9BURK